MRRDIIEIIRGGTYTHADIEELVDLAERACYLAALGYGVVELVEANGSDIVELLDAYDAPERALDDAEKANDLACAALGAYSINDYDDVLDKGESLAKFVDVNGQLRFKGIHRG